MNRLAVFVEGYTEVVFVERLIREIAGENNVLIEQKKITGGASSPRTMQTVRAAKLATGEKYYILIFDCGGDDQVKTRILEEHENLTKTGYSRLIGIRDVRPKFTHSEILKLEEKLQKYIRTSLAPVTFILAVMEIEAWFLAESTHYPRIEPSITIAAITAALGFDPTIDDMELRLYPTSDLRACYALGGKAYEKGQAKVTVDALDYAHIYLNLRRKIRYLDRLISDIDTFLT